jgi:hypothetical protein
MFLDRWAHCAEHRAVRARCSFLLLALAAAPVAPLAAQSLDEVQRSFMSRYDELNTDRDAKLEKLAEGYLAALKRLREELQKTGKLDAVLPVRDEITAVETDADPLPEWPAGIPDRLRPLRAKYQESRTGIVREHARELVALADKMVAYLKEEEAGLTKVGKVEEALVARKMSESLGTDEGLVAARALIAGKLQPLPSRSEWIPLREARLRLAESRVEYAGPADGRGYEKLHPQVRTAFAKVDDPPGSLLAVLGPCRVEFRFARPVTEFSARAYLGLRMTGPVRFRLAAGKETVAEATFDEGQTGEKPWEAKFGPTERLMLEVETGDPSGVAWSALLGGKAR